MEDEEKRGLLGDSRALIVKVKNFMVRNLGSPFILILDALILTVAFLVVGVILQVVSYVRYRSSGSDAFE